MNGSIGLLCFRKIRLLDGTMGGCYVEGKKEVLEWQCSLMVGCYGYKYGEVGLTSGLNLACAGSAVPGARVGRTKKDTGSMWARVRTIRCLFDRCRGTM